MFFPAQVGDENAATLWVLGGVQIGDQQLQGRQGIAALRGSQDGGFQTMKK